MSGYSTIEVEIDANVGYLTLHRPGAGNAIDATLVAECAHALERLARDASVVVLRGDAQTFCNGADFGALAAAAAGEPAAGPAEFDPAPLYALWTQLLRGPFVSIAYVEGRANAGGLGFVSACDIALAGPRAQFGLSELLFGLLPACVLPFLIRKVGWQRAHYMTLMTRPFDAAQACEWGLVDARDEHPERLLRAHLARLRRLPRAGVERYKRYASQLDGLVERARDAALALNREAFADACNLAAIRSFVEHGRMPWESTPPHGGHA
ncbi:putative polyketide biosynthesis enoyl-CoA hydratase pksH [Burkholderia thailandensis 34]|uniref:enoyl-CoA hydratase/isomerase n=1 Tax=Burkholderia thailandensis TaxID=57975 RepID=UPI0005D8ADF4|nr:enoyl-CoA hydratase/isomerase [Burkholderia thailandensis]AJY31869.1 putative polyketide biosynthesis enoyl-CoA hydratase pksH [Burkholderia thailandensis 34]AOJ60083.1 enoyl-CoA hydratase [Burkholderia thailandensis]KXF59451.1 enoyl-CoA hydratase [Burkholderia thailandensis]PNE78200.1 enoyl-CoA hydratase [Burkholderia thailandensis]